MFWNGALLSIVIALSLAMLALALGLIYFADEGVRRRLSAAGGARDANTSFTGNSLAWLVRFGEGMQAKTDDKDVGELRMQLVRAGIYAKKGVEVFAAVRILLALALAFVAGVSLLVFGSHSAMIGAIFVVFGAGVGLYLPVFII